MAPAEERSDPVRRARVRVFWIAFAILLTLGAALALKIAPLYVARAHLASAQASPHPSTFGAIVARQEGVPIMDRRPWDRSDDAAVARLAKRVNLQSSETVVEFRDNDAARYANAFAAAMAESVNADAPRRHARSMAWMEQALTEMRAELEQAERELDRARSAGAAPPVLRELENKAAALRNAYDERMTAFVEAGPPEHARIIEAARAPPWPNNVDLLLLAPLVLIGAWVGAFVFAVLTRPARA